MKINLLCAIGALFFSVFSFGQNPVPNASFEDWTDIGPAEWHTSNSPGGNSSNVTRTTPGRTGEYALKGEVAVWPGTPGLPFIPLLESNTSDFGFPVSELHEAVSMYYKFQPADPEDVLAVFVGVMDQNGTSFGGGFVEVSAPADTFTLLSVPINYGPGEPYRALISMTVNNYGSTGLPAIGAYFIVDDISMGDAVTTPAGEAGRPDVRRLSVFPNPVSSSLSVSFSLLAGGYVTLDLFDLTGRKVSTVFSGDLHDGDYSMPANVEALPDGLYLCRLTTAGGSLTQKIRVLKS